MQKLKKFLGNKEAMTELIRYVFAGGVTTVLAIAISYGYYALVSADHTINGANTTQVMVGNLISWVICVIFAFWINRKMVFRVKSNSMWKEFFEFAGARLVSFVLLEEGAAALLKLIGIENLWNRLIITVLVMVFNYVASKFWIFKKKDAAE